ncbi:MAG: DUF4293 family protein [Flavobacteriales bacterium]|jgi:archaellum biogenesis protein FlaJ (TadC family)|tara:strand:+ start:15412 stop:15819 length:408 start_codon:yes stop_codon:yes gene_type:complete
MIQRVQSLFFFFSSVTLLSIVFYFPVLVSVSEDLLEIGFFLKNNYTYARLFIFFSVGLSFFSIFQFKNRKRQIIISSLARLMITIAFILLVFIYKKQLAFGIGLFLLIIPYTTLFLATYFIRKDDRLIKDADRIR